MTLTDTQKEVLVDCARMEKGENLDESTHYLPTVDGERTETRTMNSLASKGLMDTVKKDGKTAFRLTERGRETASRLEQGTAK